MFLLRMPLTTQPQSLLELCYRKSGQHLYDQCCKIEQTHGDYDQEMCEFTVSVFQKHLLDILVSMLDAVGQRAIQRHLWLNSLKDCRILFAVIIYNSMESLCIIPGLPDSYEFSYFIFANLSQLTQLTQLDLTAIKCSDTELEIIGNACKKIRLLTVNNSRKHYGGHMISNSGFAHLTNLVNLRILKDSSGELFENIDKVVILELLKALINLEEIDYRYIGETITDYVGDCSRRYNKSDEMKPLALKSVKIDVPFTAVKRGVSVISLRKEPSPNLISSLARACPNLDRLELLSFDMCPDKTRDEFINNLTSSSIQVSTLALDGFAVNESFEQLLKKKGAYLTKLMLSPLQVSRSHLQLISQLCPKINNVKLTKKMLFPDVDDMSDSSKRIFSIMGSS